MTSDRNHTEVGLGQKIQQDPLFWAHVKLPISQIMRVTPHPHLAGMQRIASMTVMIDRPISSVDWVLSLE